MLLPLGLLRHRWTTKLPTTLNCQGDPRDIWIVLKPFSYSPLRPEQYYGLPWALEVGLGVLALNAHISSLWHFCGSMATNTVCNVQDERQKLDWGERLARWTLKKVNETIFPPQVRQRLFDSQFWWFIDQLTLHIQVDRSQLNLTVKLARLHPRHIVGTFDHH